MRLSLKNSRFRRTTELDCASIISKEWLCCLPMIWHIVLTRRTTRFASENPGLSAICTVCHIGCRIRKTFFRVDADGIHPVMWTAEGPGVRIDATISRDGIFMPQRTRNSELRLSRAVKQRCVMRISSLSIQLHWMLCMKNADQ